MNDFIFGTKVQPNKVHSMNQVSMTKNFLKMDKKLKNWLNIFDATSPTDFIMVPK